MQADLIMVMGLVVVFFAVPSVVSAWSEGRPPRVAALSFLLGLALAFYATTIKPGGYDLIDVPMAFIHVAGLVLN